MDNAQEPEFARSNGERFIDGGERIYDLGDEILVVCPKCSGMAKVILSGDLPAKPTGDLFAPRRLICTKCWYRNNWAGRKVTIGEAVDWFFGMPLWLTDSCCGEVLWAYNLRHLEMIEGYVAAKLRERTKGGRNSFLCKLPKWLQSAKNRDEIMRSIRRLKEKLNAGN
ncbi:MAG: hypothetical protein K1X36_09045 [Pyrinomonadaceae bacterium]|nr:hypothetical protein [Pyrinomonadaceae bacterium]